MKYSIMYHGDGFKDYDTLEDLLADKWMFKNIYQMGGYCIYKSDDLTEEEEKIIDARSWEIRGWGYLPDPRSSTPKDDGKMMPRCFGRFSEDSQGRHSVECDYCPAFDKCYQNSNTQR